MNIDYSKLPRRDLLCVDVKSFFASVEAVRRNIHPLEAYIIVVSDFKRPGAVVLASSPKVKKEYGIKTGSRKFEIPDDKQLILTEPSMGLYLKVNQQICNIFRRFVAEEDLWIYSIDEAFLDVSSTRKLFGKPEEMANKIQNDILKELGLITSIGIGDNPLLAKLALDNEAKKQTSQIAYWSYENVPDTIWKIPRLTDMWGISRGYEKKLRNLGITSIYTLAHSDPNLLKSQIGIMGLQLFYHSRGVDYSRLSERMPSKNQSYGKGQILMRDYFQKKEIIFIITEMAEEVAGRLRKNHMYCTGISLFIGYSKSEAESGFKKDYRLPAATQQTYEIVHYFKLLFEQYWKEQPVRQVYVSCSKIISAEFRQPELFPMFDGTQDEKEQEIDLVIDGIRNKYGKTAIFKAYNLTSGSTFLERSGYIGGHKGGFSQ